ncbi:MAG: Threonine-tRNA ligase [Parcubacteria group bacterium GW2011_GWA2_47_10]|nr:MAG: Threonine-tRNA ligase [Parcubacteria group bacterium GW2011_GWA2_47_10]
MNELLRENSIECVVAEGEAAFYGPKMDLMIRDSLGRQWQLSTIQLDFNMPIRFGLSYIDADGKKVAPAMIHSALVGSPERFFGILIEHYVGDFPFWLSPIQISILSVNERVIDYCRMIQAALQKEGFRIRIDDRNESIGKKIREAELSKAPYALIVGDREAAASTVSVRRRKKGDLGVITLENLIKLLRGEAL